MRTSAQIPDSVTTCTLIRTCGPFSGCPSWLAARWFAALYLAEKIGGDTFTEADQRLVETLAGHAALAVVNVQRQERLRELSIMDERTRIARDLHDSVTQTLFSLTLAAESAATVAGAGSPASIHLDRVRDLSRTALDELRALVDTLRLPDVDREGGSQVQDAFSYS